MAKIDYIHFDTPIGDSLSAIQNNFTVIDQELQTIELTLSRSINKLANFINAPVLENYNINTYDLPNIVIDEPTIIFNNTTPAQQISLIESIIIKQNFIEQNFNTLNSIATKINDNKYTWEQATTLVASNSARWLKPITFLYPCIFDEPTFRATNKIRDEVTQWLNKHFPVINAAGHVNYPEYQKAYIGITYKLSNIHPNHTDNTIHDNIQTLIFLVKDCTWRIIDYLIGDQIAPSPSPASTVTPTPSPTDTPPPTVTPTGTPEVTPTPTITPTTTPADYFTMTLLGMSLDTFDDGEHNGSISIRCNCYHKGMYTIRIGGTVVDSFLDDEPATIGRIPSGTHYVTIHNFNYVTADIKSIQAELVVPKRTGNMILTYRGSRVYPGPRGTIQSAY